MAIFIIYNNNIIIIIIVNQGLTLKSKKKVVDPALDLLLQESFSLFDTQSGCISDKVM